MTAPPRIDAARIREVPADALAAYLWRRLRLEEPLDPPLNHRFGQEPPEKVVITAWRQSKGDPDFSDRLEQAIRSNLRRLAPTPEGLAADPVMREQVSSLAFLAGAVGAVAVARPLTALARTLWAAIKAASRPMQPLAEPQPEAALQDPLFHIIDAVSDLDDGPALAPFWREILDWSCDRGLRSIAWFGLSCADPDGLLRRLGNLVEDSVVRLPSVAWHLVRRSPGPERLGTAARARLTDGQQQRLRDAMEEAQVDTAALQAFDGRLFAFTTLRPGAIPIRREPNWGICKGARFGRAA